MIDRLRTIVDALPPDASVTFSVAWLTALLDAEGDSPGTTGRLLTLEQAGEIMARSPGTVRTWANGGQLPGAFKLNNRTWRIPESALQRFIAQQQSGEHEPPTVGSSESVDLGAWRKHAKSRVVS